MYIQTATKQNAVFKVVKNMPHFRKIQIKCIVNTVDNGTALIPVSLEIENVNECAR